MVKLDTQMDADFVGRRLDFVDVRFVDWIVENGAKKNIANIANVKT